jgi:hypothetical protein
MTTIIIIAVIAAFVAAMFFIKRNKKSSAVVVPIRPPVVPSPPPAQTLAESYPSVEALVEFIERTHFDSQVTVDGKVINVGFGPAAQFKTAPDGSVRR